MSGGGRDELVRAVERRGDSHKIVRELLDRLDRYLRDLPRLLERAEPMTLEGEELLDLAERYYHDGRYYLAHDLPVEAFACLSYAWALLKAGKEAGLLELEGEV
ncbi:MAG: DUF357 domain-containing protein [Euryarchaeota archaeon]